MLLIDVADDDDCGQGEEGEGGGGRGGVGEGGGGGGGRAVSWSADRKGEGDAGGESTLPSSYAGGEGGVHVSAGGVLGGGEGLISDTYSESPSALAGRQPVWLAESGQPLDMDFLNQLWLEYSPTGAREGERETAEREGGYLQGEDSSGLDLDASTITPSTPGGDSETSDERDERVHRKSGVLQGAQCTFFTGTQVQILTQVCCKGFRTANRA
jgi:hypothetical protein